MTRWSLLSAAGGTRGARWRPAVLAAGLGGQALLYSWDEITRASVLDALADEAWRVREMAAKVVARRLLGEALAAVAG